MEIICKSEWLMIGSYPLFVIDYVRCNHWPSDSQRFWGETRFPTSSLAHTLQPLCRSVVRGLLPRFEWNDWRRDSLKKVSYQSVYRYQGGARKTGIETTYSPGNPRFEEELMKIPWDSMDVSRLDRVTVTWPCKTRFVTASKWSNF